MQNVDKIAAIKSNWQPEEIYDFFEFLDPLFKTYSISTDFEVKRLWLMLLHQHPMPEVIQAIGQTLSTKKIYGRPTPDQVLELLNGGNADDKANQAWAEVAEAIRVVGLYQSPQFSSSRTANAVSMVGWVNLCSAPNPAALERITGEFLSFFAIANDTGEAFVLGLVDQSRLQKGLPINTLGHRPHLIKPASNKSGALKIT